MAARKAGTLNSAANVLALAEIDEVKKLLCNLARTVKV